MNNMHSKTVRENLQPVWIEDNHILNLPIAKHPQFNLIKRTLSNC